MSNEAVDFNRTFTDDDGQTWSVAISDTVAAIMGGITTVVYFRREGCDQTVATTFLSPPFSDAQLRELLAEAHRG